MTRSQSREQAFALLFEKSFHPDADLETLTELSLINGTLQDDPFTFRLAETAWAHLYDIDEVIDRLTQNWSRRRLSRVALSALRLGIAELQYLEDIPTGATINECVELCKLYGGENDASFVNGVLGALARESTV
ncbi:MAG: transcription antitermination factor NusB [Oscillospiraceae bacterium]|jgi:N utilization substance protein B|nr:transcription antitermination factor NusB [Oscillospiraceae bacterium]